MKLVGLSGATAGSKTSKVVHDLLVLAKQMHPELQTNLLDLKEYDMEFVRGVPLSYYNDDTIAVVKQILQADILVIASPIYQASLTGALKNLFDLLPENALKYKPVGLITLAGSEKHFLVAEHQIKPILSFLKASVPTNHIFVHNDQFDENNDIADPNYYRRLQRLVTDLMRLQST
ncbi:NADPH-dependent FMN reductase [Paenibacillus yanchengensis]|uniref:NADPH-dependent FMN reductase n=1 Tax=Paenibacillus yanchengensis TaxID=2035833 RepID=A0ABW4YJH9_9BACL